MQTIHNTHPISVRKNDGVHDTSLINQLLQASVSAFRKFQNRRKLKHMLDLSPHLLNDIGLTRSDVVDAIGSSRFQNPTDVLNARRAARITELTDKIYGHRKF
jgi:uncharacterized protein YjiS (DUF1127 family)